MAAIYPNRTILLAIALMLAAIVVAINTKMFKFAQPHPDPVTLVGAVLRQSSDSRKQTPLAGVVVTGMVGAITVTGKSDPSGFFSLTLSSRPQKGQAVTLSFAAPDL